jgi:hypothetical protein
MSNSMSDNEQPDQDTLELLNCAFPTGLNEAEYLPLLYILRKDMTIRAASSFVGALMEKDSFEIYNDALGINNKTYELSIIEDLISRLESCGYRIWLDS